MYPYMIISQIRNRYRIARAALFGDTMIRALFCGAVLFHPNQSLYICKVCPAVFRKTMGLFSTKFYLPPYKQRKRKKIFYIHLICAFALRQMRLFFVKKCRFLTYYSPRAPPSPFLDDFQHKISRLEDNTMVIKYKFSDNATSEVEVDDELGKTMEQMALDDFNLNRKETRRHVYMSVLEEKGCYIPDNNDPLDDVLKAELIKELMAAVEKLQPQQKELLIRVYWNKELQKDIVG